MSRTEACAGDLARRLEPIFAPYDTPGAPGVTVGVRLGGETFRRGYGLQSLESGLVNRPDVRVRIGSTTKPFTCLALMLLAEAGAVDLDADVRRWLPELSAGIEPVTARRLMNHTAGVRCHMDLWSLTTGMSARWPDSEPFDLMTRLTSRNFRPGTRVVYSNGGYVLLSRLAERVSGTPFDHLLRERIFIPCGLHDTELLRRDGDLRPRMAGLHVPSGDGWRRGCLSIPLEGEGGLISTVDDLLDWAGQLSAPRVGSPALWRAMSARTPLEASTPGAEGLSDYGLGLIMRRHRGLDTLGHAGAVLGARCELLTVPDHDLDLVILANRSDIGLRDLAHRVVDALLGPVIEPPPVRASAADVAPYEGVYVDASTGQFLSLSGEAGGAVVDFGSAKAPLTLGENGLAFAGALGDMAFRLPEVDGGAGAGLTVVECGVARAFQRLTPLAATSWPPAGRYGADDLPAEAVLDVAEDGARLTVQTPFGRVEYRVSPLSQGRWRIEEEKDGAGGWSLLELGQAHGRPVLWLSTLRTWRLEFQAKADVGPASCGP
ncbi:MAG: serine hydrolase [Caulobacteraceae bacterium]|nr:serine hydrolase [Caulobacteraceae bacterium]